MEPAKITLRGMLAAGLLAVSAAPALADAEPSLPRPAFEVSSVRSDVNRPARRFREPYKGDVIDALAHVSPPSRGGKSRTMDPGVVLDQIAAAGAALAYLMPTPNEGGNAKREDGTENKIALAKRGDGRIRIFCGGDYLTAWLYAAQIGGYREDELKSRLRRLEAELDGGVCAGIGEFGLLHFNKTGNQPEIRLRPTFPPVLEVISLASRKGAWIDVHAEPMEPDGISHEAEVFGALALWFGRDPNLKLMLSHTAMTNPVNARRLLAAYPNVMLTVKLVKSTDRHWQNLEPVINHRGELYEDWAQLFEEMPGRFLVGSDTKFANEKHGSGDKYDETIALFRNVLGSLAPPAADTIARDNARRLLGGAR
jgi:amidohydrolase family protein